MRISDWSSDVCSSDLVTARAPDAAANYREGRRPPSRHSQSRRRPSLFVGDRRGPRAAGEQVAAREHADRKSVVWGRSVSVGVDLGGRRSIKKKNTHEKNRIDNPITKEIYHINI